MFWMVCTFCLHTIRSHCCQDACKQKATVFLKKKYRRSTKVLQVLENTVSDATCWTYLTETWFDWDMIWLRHDLTETWWWIISSILHTCPARDVRLGDCCLCVQLFCYVLAPPFWSASFKHFTCPNYVILYFAEEYGVYKPVSIYMSSVSDSNRVRETRVVLRKKNTLIISEIYANMPYNCTRQIIFLLSVFGYF